MTSWQPLPLDTDPQSVTARILDALAAALPGWVPREGAVEVALAEEIGAETAATNARAVDAAEVAAVGIGISVHGLPAITAVPARLPVQLTVRAAGDVIPAGFTVVGTTVDGVEVAFALPAAVTAQGTAVPVVLRALLEGTVGNGVPAGPLQVITATATVLGAASTGPSVDGVDAESRADYLGRLIDYLAILRPGGVRAADLVVLARSVPGVARAMAVDLYDADTGQTGAERTVSVYPVDAGGQPVSAGTAAALRAALEDVREVNFRIRVGQPTYTPVHVTVTAVAEDGADPAAVGEAVRAAVLAHLSPARWGARPSDPDGWTATSLVRYLPLIRAAGSVDGLLYLDEVTVNGGTADVVLPGVAALPAAAGAGGSSVTVSVT